MSHSRSTRIVAARRRPVRARAPACPGPPQVWRSGAPDRRWRAAPVHS